ncbi:Insulin-like growth factor binding protein, N-terminal [Pseudocohnilembus persalinus]|uniref:Insulin-like growth factor binding protein, N-terminal n=1 Tax=Pseudocohnilembus persalinus TaxID=266149 RepID=A0A0V0R659_PSEPJ|nr:Insulin-like growth factor binding protein, N-terminal [Pseudocohnilembus persalinus]|eukprot:KRX09959.1 Insulin-like growth factor binding protein, N-terminal [Pseudocohnilembus persalinus]
MISLVQINISQWQETDISNTFVLQSFKQRSSTSRQFDSLQISQGLYANLVRNKDNPGEIKIFVSDENGNQQCNRELAFQNYFKSSMTNTNVQGEIFIAYVSDYKIHITFLNSQCNFERGLNSGVQPTEISQTFESVLTKTGNDYTYILGQDRDEYLHLSIVDIRNSNNYNIIQHFQLGSQKFKYNFFSIQGFQDNYAIIFAKDENNDYKQIAINPVGTDTWDPPKSSGIFMTLINQKNYIQNKAIQIEDQQLYTIVTGDEKEDIFQIFTFQYNGSGQIQQKCLQTYNSEFQNVGNEFYIAMQFGVINSDIIWIKGDNKTGGDCRSVIFFANPLKCQVYRNQNDLSIYQYKYDNICISHVFHTYQSNSLVSLIALSSYINGNQNQDLKVIKIDNGDCPQYCTICSGSYTCQSCIESDGKRDVSNLCICKNGYYQDTGSDDCIECPYYCSTCSDSATCQNCILAAGERDPSNLCNCKNGYYQDVGSNDCLGIQ